MSTSFSCIEPAGRNRAGAPWTLAGTSPCPAGELAGRVLRWSNDLAGSRVTLGGGREGGGTVLQGHPCDHRPAQCGHHLACQGVSNYAPEYYVEKLPTSPWIYFQPFQRDYGLAAPGRGLAKKYLV